MGALSNNLKIYRKSCGYTQEQAAERVGVSRQSVAKWERGDTLPDITNVIALADLYEISVDSLVRDLVSLTDEPSGKKHMFGVTRVNGSGQITLPEECRRIFGINAGDTLLILGDESKGIAVVKVPEISEKG